MNLNDRFGHTPFSPDEKINVAMEIFVAAPHSEKFDLIYSIQVALLHDTIEDTSTTFDEIKEAFGEE